MGAPARPYNYTAGQLFTGPGQLAGLAISETGGVAGKVRLWDGTSAAGVRLAVLNVAANGSNALLFAGVDIRFETGVFVETVTGTIEGTVYIG